VTYTGDKPPKHEKVESPFTGDDDPLGLGGTDEAIEVMSAIHWGPDGYIPLASQQEGKWKEIGAIEVEKLKTMLPGIAKWLVKDSYFALSSFFTQQMETFKDGSRAPYTNWSTDLPNVHRKGSNLRWLNTCFADIDLHDGGDFAALLADVVRLQDAGSIPPASIIGRSGRGVWLFWLLHGIKDPTHPQPAWPEKIQLFSRVQHGISERLHELGLTVDGGCSSPTALTRVPGSINTKAEQDHQRVRYWIQLGPKRRPYLYDLYEMAAAFGVAPRKTSFELRGDVDEEVSKVKRRGWRKRWENTMEDFQTLRAIRGRFAEGTRSNAVWLQSVLLRRLGRLEEEIATDAIELGDDCRPPLPLWKSRRIAKDSGHYDTYHISYRKCMEMLKVTPDEAAMLNHWPRPGREAKGRKASRETRQEMIRAVVNDLGSVPSCRVMADELGKRGIKASHTTCRTDYQALGLRSEPKPTTQEPETLPPLFAVEASAATTGK
jgi:hypothetical protein